MTIAISVKVHDGVVLATDSAASMGVTFPGGVHHIVNVYNNANKIYNLRKGLPIGAMVWGARSRLFGGDMVAPFREEALDRAWEMPIMNGALDGTSKPREVASTHPTGTALPALTGGAVVR